MEGVLTLGAALLLACGGGGTGPQSGPPGVYQVLFIGNSLTYVNDLPGTVARLGGMADVTIHVESVALPNLAVIDHVTGMSNAVATIQGGHWDYVVLQQGPSSVEANRQDLIVITEDLGLAAAVSLASGGFIKGLGAQRPYDQGVTEVTLAGYGLLGKTAPPYVALPPLPVTKANVLQAWQDVYHVAPPDQLKAAYKP